MRDERPGRGAAGDGMHHRRFHFQVAARIEKPPQFPDDPRAGEDNLARFLIRDQVKIPLAVADFHVRQTVPFLRQRQKGLCKQGQLLDPNGELIRFRAEEMPRDPNGVAEVEQLEEFKCALTNSVELHVDLNPRCGALNVRETRLAHQTVGNDPPCDAHLTFLRLEVRSACVREFFDQRRRRLRPAKLAWIGVVAQSLDVFQLFLALPELVEGLKFQRCILSEESSGSIAAHA